MEIYIRFKESAKALSSLTIDGSKHMEDILTQLSNSDPQEVFPNLQELTLCTIQTVSKHTDTEYLLPNFGTLHKFLPLWAHAQNVYLKIFIRNDFVEQPDHATAVIFWQELRGVVSQMDNLREVCFAFQSDVYAIEEQTAMYTISAWLQALPDQLKCIQLVFDAHTNMFFQEWFHEVIDLQNGPGERFKRLKTQHWSTKRSPFGSETLWDFFCMREPGYSSKLESVFDHWVRNGRKNLCELENSCDCPDNKAPEIPALFE